MTLAEIIAPIVEGQIKSFLHDHPEVAEAWARKLAQGKTKQRAVTDSLAKRIINDLLSVQVVVRMKAALVEPAAATEGAGVELHTAPATSEPEVDLSFLLAQIDGLYKKATTAPLVVFTCDGKASLLPAMREGEVASGLSEEDADWFRAIHNSWPALKAAVEALSQENFALAANQCRAGMAGDGGDHVCAEQESVKAKITTLFDAIKHGDERHQAWLKEAIDAHFSGKPVPKVEAANKGLKETAANLSEQIETKAAWDQLIAERDRAREALERHGCHLADCSIIRKFSDGCDCGLLETLRALKGTKP